jgi:hypothetical protein
MVKDPSDMDLDTAFNVFDEKLLPLCIHTLPQVGKTVIFSGVWTSSCGFRASLGPVS